MFEQYSAVGGVLYLYSAVDVLYLNSAGGLLCLYLYSATNYKRQNTVCSGGKTIQALTMLPKSGL